MPTRETLGVALAQTGDYSCAIAAWREFVKLRPREYTGHYNLGSYEMSRQPPAALESFRAALPQR